MPQHKLPRDNDELVEELNWLSEGGMAWWEIARKLGVTADGLNVALRDRGLTDRVRNASELTIESSRERRERATRAARTSSHAA